MRTLPRRQVLRQKQNEILTELSRSAQQTLQMQKIQTDILLKSAQRRSQRKIQVAEMVRGIKPIRALVVDPAEDVFTMVKKELSMINGTSFSPMRASSLPEATKLLSVDGADVILLSGSFFGPEKDVLRNAMREMRRVARYDVPIIVYVETDVHEWDMMALEAGASDFLENEEINPYRFEKSIRYCLKRAH